MKKLLFMAAIAMAMVGCGKQSAAGIWSMEREGEGPKPLLVLNEDGTAQSMGMPVRYESWKQEGDNLILNGKLMPRHHGRHGKKFGQECGEKPCRKDSANGPMPERPCCKQGAPEGKPECCKEGMKEGEKPCCKDMANGPMPEKPCCKQGAPEGKPECCKEGMKEGEKPCCKKGKPEAKEVNDTIAIKSLSKETLTLEFTCPKSGEKKEVSFKKLDEMPPMPQKHEHHKQHSERHHGPSGMPVSTDAPEGAADAE